MKWEKQAIPVEKIPEVTNRLLLAIKNGDDKIEKMRCVYKAENSAVTVILMPYDFIDLNPKPKIVEFYLCQVLEN